MDNKSSTKPNPITAMAIALISILIITTAITSAFCFCREAFGTVQTKNQKKLTIMVKHEAGTDLVCSKELPDLKSSFFKSIGLPLIINTLILAFMIMMLRFPQVFVSTMYRNAGPKIPVRLFVWICLTIQILLLIAILIYNIYRLNL